MTYTTRAIKKFNEKNDTRLIDRNFDQITERLIAIDVNGDQCSQCHNEWAGWATLVKLWVKPNSYPDVYMFDKEGNGRYPNLEF